MAHLFKDLAESYKRNRPKYPKEVVNEILRFYCENTITKDKNKPGVIVDVACGTGQLTQILASYADKVIGVDINASQIKEAILNNKFTNVEYKVSGCESLPAEDGAVDVITVAEAIHWFPFQEFYKEVNRCLAPGGCVAIVGYNYGIVCCAESSDIQTKIQTLSKEYYRGESGLGAYWDERRFFLDELYKTIPLPYENHERFESNIDMEFTAKSYCGYLKTMAGYTEYFSQHPDREDIAEAYVAKVLEYLGESPTNMDAKLFVSFPLFLVCCAKPLS